jgi:hypothetical protein
MESTEGGVAAMFSVLNNAVLYDTSWNCKPEKR